MKFKLLIIFLSFYNFCISQVPDLYNWKIDTLQNKNESRRNVQMTSIDWKFSKNGGKWEIVKNEHKLDTSDSLPVKAEPLLTKLSIDTRNRFVKKIRGGYLVGIWEWETNGFYFIKNDGLSGYKIQGPRHIRFHHFFEYNGKYYAFDGSAQAHELSHKGQIVELYQKNNVWVFKSVSKMTENPEILVDYKNGKLVLTARSLLKFGKDIKPIEILQSPFFWGILFPSSMLINNNDLYIAMQGGVLKIIAFDTNPSYEWWVPK
jgi:hypothetical protein